MRVGLSTHIKKEFYERIYGATMSADCVAQKISVGLERRLIGELKHTRHEKAWRELARYSEESAYIIKRLS